MEINFSECPTKLNCSWYNQYLQYKDKYDNMERYCQKLKSSVEIVKLLENTNEDINAIFEKKLSEKIHFEQSERNNLLQEQNKKLEEQNKSLQEQNKKLLQEKLYLQDIFDRDLELQETEKKYQILKSELEKMNKTKTKLKIQLEADKEDLKITNESYNEIATEYNSMRKEIFQFKKELKIFKKKKIKKDKIEEKKQLKKIKIKKGWWR